MTPQQAAAVVATILIQLSGLHLYWAAGGRRFLGAVIPRRPPQTSQTEGTPLFQATPMAALVVALFLASSAWVVAASQKLVWSPFAVATIQLSLRTLASLFLLRALGDFRYVGFFKKVRGNRFAFWDSWLYSPLCLFLGSLVAWLSLEVQ